jgi:hypothetical protein
MRWIGEGLSGNKTKAAGPIRKRRRSGMLGLFSPKPTHPLADDKERQRILGEIASADALTALKEAVDWLRTLVDAGGMPFGARSLLVRQIDDVAQRPAHVLGREYLTMAHLSDEEEIRLWRATRGFWTQLAATYNACLGDFMRSAEKAEDHRTELTRLAARLMRAYGARLKWDQFRYWPASEVLWQNMGRAYLYALDNGFARRQVSAYPGERQQTTVEQAYLHALVFHISAMDSLLPFEIEIAERLIAHFLPRIALTTEADAGSAYWVDPEQRRPPGRAVGKLEPSLSRFYFSPSQALGPLLELQALLERGQMPGDLDLARYRSPRIILPVVQHLASYWTAHPPKREHNRYAVRSQLAVVAGLDAAHRSIASRGMAVQAATWTVENVSIGGIRARLPMAPEEQLRIGSLLGMRPEGGDNWLVGVVRRFARNSDMQASAAVETLSRKPICAMVEGDPPAPALLLDPPEEGEALRLAVSAMTYQPGRTIACDVLGTRLDLEPVELVERGVEFDLVRYRVLAQT